MKNISFPVFCFSPAKLITGGVNPQFYVAWAKKIKKDYHFSYLIIDETISSNGEFMPKIAANSEVYPSKDALTDRLFKFIDNFTPHQRISDNVFLNFCNTDSKTLDDVATEFCVCGAAEASQEFFKMVNFTRPRRKLKRKNL